jgi:asparagine synthase (glutamine-hydrolysing)
VAFASQLDWKYLFHRGIEKHLLRETMRTKVCASIINTPKHPFIAPPIKLYQSPKGQEFIADLLHSSAFKSIPFVNVPKAFKLFDKMKRLDHLSAVPYDAVWHTLISLYYFSKIFKMN